MAFQNQATLTLAIGYEGDTWGAPFYNDRSMLVTGDAGVNIGKFVYQVINTENSIVQAKGSNTTLAGLVWRSQTNVNVTQGLTTTSSMVIAEGQNAGVQSRGNYIVKIDTIVGSSAVAQNSIVYTDSNGLIVANGGGTMTSYTATNFVFKSISSELTVGSLVKISNVQNVV